MVSAMCALGSLGRRGILPLPPVQLTCRLMHEKWRPGLKPDHLLRVLQCTRLLSRDKTLRQRFVTMGAVNVSEQSDNKAHPVHNTLGCLGTPLLT